MSKYIYNNLDHYLKLDSKFIKIIHPELKKSDILNNFSQILGWRHYNELQTHIKKESFHKFNEISKLNYKDLNEFKMYYFDKIYEKYPIVKEYDFDDPYQIRKSFLYQIVNSASVIFDKEKGNCLKVDLSQRKGFIRMSNIQTESLINELINRVENEINSGSMWLGRVTVFKESLLTAFKNDNRGIDFQYEIQNIFSFNYLADYVKKYLKDDANEKKHIIGLSNFVLNMPGYHSSDNEIPQTTLDQYGYIMMYLHMMKKSFLSINSCNTKTYLLNDLISHNGAIEFIYDDERDNLMDIKTLYNVIMKLRKN